MEPNLHYSAHKNSVLAWPDCEDKNTDIYF
jgi:hypothetical protein